MIRDMIVLNSVNKYVQERLLETDDLDLSKALKIAKIHETNIEQMKLISNTDVHYVGSRRERKPATRHKPATRQRYTAPPVRRTDGARPKTWRSPDDAKCSNCGRIHTRQTCPAQNETCHNCGKLNHFAAMCRSTVPTQSAAGRHRKASTTSACNQRFRLRYVGPRVYNRMPVSQCEYSPFWRTALYNTSRWL